MNLSRSAANMSDEPATWPDDDEDPFAPVEPTEEIADEEVIEDSITAVSYTHLTLPTR